METPIHPLRVLPGRLSPGACLVPLLLLLAAGPARATISTIRLPGIVQVEAADLDGIPGDELVAATDDAHIHVFTRTGLGWSEIGDYPLTADFQPQHGDFQIVQGFYGPKDIVYFHFYYDTQPHYAIGLLGGHGDGTFGPLPLASPEFVGVVPMLPGSLMNFPAPGSPGTKFVVPCARNDGEKASALYYFSRPLGVNSDTLSQPIPDLLVGQFTAQDFNGDGFTDQLALGLVPTGPNTYGEEGYYRLGTGFGTFGSWSLTGGASNHGDPIHASDLDGDGFPEAMFGNSDPYNGFQATVISGGASWPQGAYNAAEFTGAQFFATRFADVNEDHFDDLVAAYGLPVDPNTSSDLSEAGFLVQAADPNGGARFGDEVRFPVWPQPAGSGGAFTLCVGQLTDDTHLDVAMATPNGLSIYPGDGSGGFETAPTSPTSVAIPLGDDPLDVLELADLDHAHGLDVLIGSDASDGVGLRRVANVGSGLAVTDEIESSAVNFIGVDGVTSNVYTADFDFLGGTLWNSGTQSLDPWVELDELDGGGGSGQPLGFAVRDLDSDGRADLFALSAGAAGEHYEVSVANSSIGFQPATHVSCSGLITAPTAGFAFVPGYPATAALLSQTGDLVFLSGVTPASYSSSSTVALGAGPQPAGSPHAFTFAQFAGPGGPLSMILRTGNTNRVEVFESSGIDLTTWNSTQVLPTIGEPYAVAVGDIDQVNGLDVVVACRNPNGLTIHRNDGAGGFTREDLPTGSVEVRDVGIGDVTGDGRADLVYLTTALLAGSKPGARPNSGSPISTVAAISYSGLSTTAVGQPHANAPERLALRVTPNPVRGAITVLFSMPAAGRASLELVDLAGRRIGERIERESAAGPQEWRLRDLAPSRDVAAGVYFVRLTTPFGSVTTRFVKLK